MKHYGKELILDLWSCKKVPFSRPIIGSYCRKLCELIDMDSEDLHFWDYEEEPFEYEKAPSHLKGISAVQFISTSNITVHALDDLFRVYINIFSCKDFDEIKAANFSEEYFGGLIVNRQTVLRH